MLLPHFPCTTRPCEEESELRLFRGLRMLWTILVLLLILWLLGFSFHVAGGLIHLLLVVALVVLLIQLITGRRVAD